MFLYIKIMMALFLYFIQTFPLYSEEVTSEDECLTCHSDSKLSTERNGKKISLAISSSRYSKSVHGALGCIDCHDGFDKEKIPHKKGKNIFKVNCGSCHTDYIAQIKSDIHHRLNVADAPECSDCHGSHEITDPSRSKNKSADYCIRCHKNIVLANPYHSTLISNDKCIGCHKSVDIHDKLSRSVHPKLNCADCHNFISNNLTLHPQNVKHTQIADCYVCHSNVANEHRDSIHGISLDEGIDEAAMCWNCHGSHDILRIKDMNSKVYPDNIPSTCGNCHDNPEIVKKFGLSMKEPGLLYAKSVHGQLLAAGNKKAPDCGDCHGVHNIMNKIQTDSTISVFKIPETCGKCHNEITVEYTKSIHWIRAKKGVRESPVCNDCHSEHGIQRITPENKREETKKIQEAACLRCHQDQTMVERYSLSGGQVKQYKDSYHGLAVKRGDSKAAFCIDCHSAHRILPKDHPESSVNPENVTTTCQKCHPEAKDIFSKSYTHQVSTVAAEKIEKIVTKIYTWLIIFVIGGMFFHNAIIFIHEIRKRRKKEKGNITLSRFTLSEIIQHIILLSTFITLVITGFALKFPVSWWSVGLLKIGMTETLRQNIHRVTAVIMIAAGFYHLIYVFASQRGREIIRAIFPRFRDLTDFVLNLKYYLGFAKKRPFFDKYDYTEKAEYWALIWGTMIMGMTGLILWFPTLVGNWAPVWIIRVSEIIHFYEAILATLAILIWHWFFVIFHPSEYPMSFTWIDGKMSLVHYRHSHEMDFREFVREYIENKEGKRECVSHRTKLFTQNLETNGFNPDAVIQKELENDPELRLWLHNRKSLFR